MSAPHPQAGAIAFAVAVLKRLAETQSRPIGEDVAVLVEDIETMADSLRLALEVLGAAPASIPPQEAPAVATVTRFTTEERLAAKEARLAERASRGGRPKLPPEEKRARSLARQKRWREARKAAAAEGSAEG